MTESYFDENQNDLSIEEDREDHEARLRYERRQRMRRERQRRMRRRQMMQRALFFVIVGVIAVLIAATVKHNKEADGEGAQDETLETVEQSDRLEIEKIRESIREEEPGKLRQRIRKKKGSLRFTGLRRRKTPRLSVRRKLSVRTPFW